ncbi:MAG: DUF389 domain-containing protein [Bacteroidetes bacterium HGW-Bacteroidetes-10]|nr:MAG: DUF389 domain-containing protein [Bacteroidetes bacterium HGW-Bacteroidetes-10]
MSKFYEQLKDIANLSEHIDIPGTIESIKKSIDFKGANVWILAFAVIVASVGLNVNSTPVIIGAMLISPLMGPIIGAGLSIGINDSQLLKRSLRNLAIMVIISIIASTAFFAISPLSLDEPTELLARTRPTIYDVFIAFFGGLAGIIEGSRKEKGTVIAGVAIATALMPPLCTAGYGIANLNLAYIAGAVYLFFINSLFIALATFLMVRYLKFPFVKFADPARQRKVRRSISFIAILMIIPSIYTAVIVIQENSFNVAVKRFVKENKALDNSYIYDYSINHSGKSSILELSIAGEKLNNTQKELLFVSLEKHGVSRNNLVFKESATIENNGDENIVKSILERNDLEIKKREEMIRNMESELRTIKSKEIPYRQIAEEILAQHPGMVSFSIGRGADVSLKDFNAMEQIVVLASWSKRLPDAEIEKLEKWLSVRMNEKNLRVVQVK